MKIGLIKGRHPLPVESYLIEDETVEFDQAHQIAYKAMLSFLGQTEKDEVIQLYITGLTRCSLGAIAAFQNIAGDCNVGSNHTSNRVLEIWEYNSQTSQYETVVQFRHGSVPNDTSVFEYGYVIAKLD
ncbi:hypothetical protein [Paenibacillus elgii]|uniref:hypothetical protein n=1 Tax=Paenibacillus elgii TaxID=189691 RepID=UPI000248C7D8|nr:hypothetical protein [Paenibacillus elgii]